jgi:hypothetical protein
VISRHHNARSRASRNIPSSQRTQQPYSQGENPRQPITTGTISCRRIAKSSKARLNDMFTSRYGQTENVFTIVR